jgi:hypothetical protein
MSTAIPTGYTKKATINKKAQLSQVSAMNNSQPFVDGSGNQLTASRKTVNRSMFDQVRRLINASGSYSCLFTSGNIVMNRLLNAPPGDVASFINLVKLAIAAYTGDDVTPSANVPSRDWHKLLHSLAFIEGTNGRWMIDDLGNDFTSYCYRPKMTRSLRDLMRRLMRANSETAGMVLNTGVGAILENIKNANPGTMTALNNVISNFPVSSNSATPQLEPSSRASAISPLDQLQQLLVTCSDGSIAINDTNDNLAQPNLSKSMLKQLEAIITSNGEVAPTFKIQTTSSMKLRRVASLSTGASLPQLVSALTARA